MACMNPERGEWVGVLNPERQRGVDPEASMDDRPGDPTSYPFVPYYYLYLPALLTLYPVPSSPQYHTSTVYGGTLWSPIVCSRRLGQTILHLLSTDFEKRPSHQATLEIRCVSSPQPYQMTFFLLKRLRLLFPHLLLLTSSYNYSSPKVPILPTEYPFVVSS